MPEDVSGQRLIKNSFTSKELEFLHQQPEFNEGLENLKTLTDFEKLVSLGNLILLSRLEAWPGVTSSD